MRRLFPLLFIAPILLGLAACAGDNDKLKQVDQPVGNLYNDAYDQLALGNYKKAADMFEEVERQHPYSNWATKADLMAAFSQYQGLHYEDAVGDLDRFIQLHPGHPDIAYAYYLKALCSFEQINDANRDQTDTQNALTGFEDVVRRYPNTPYAKDATNKIALSRDRLAAQDMVVGRYYEKHFQYIAAIKRFRNVAENYQTTTEAPEALLRLVECYKALGIDTEARRIAAVLGYNYPGSQWYKDAYDLVGGPNGPIQKPMQQPMPVSAPLAKPAPTPVAPAQVPVTKPVAPAKSDDDDQSDWFSDNFGSIF